MPMCQNKNVGSWGETSIWQSVKSRSGFKIIGWNTKRMDKEKQISIPGINRKMMKAVAAPQTITIWAIQVLEITPVITTVTPITIQVTRCTMEATLLRGLMSVPQPMPTMILIQPQQPRRPQLQRQQQLPVILKIQIHFISKLNRYVITKFE